MGDHGQVQEIQHQQTTQDQGGRRQQALHTNLGHQNNHRSGRQGVRGAGTTVMEYTERHII